MFGVKTRVFFGECCNMVGFSLAKNMAAKLPHGQLLEFQELETNFHFWDTQYISIHANLRYPPPKLPPPINKALLRDY